MVKTLDDVKIYGNGKETIDRGKKAGLLAVWTVNFTLINIQVHTHTVEAEPEEKIP